MDLYPFAFKPKFPAPAGREYGWNMFDELVELKRIMPTNGKWRITHANAHFDLCTSYPPILAVPADVDDSVLHEVAAFRQHGRLPVLSYCDAKTGAVLLRAAQPLVGSGARCYEDERLFRSVLQASSNTSKGYIVDLRTQAEAVSQKTKGGGPEQAEHYFNWNLIYAKLGKVKAFEEDLAKFLEGIQANDSSLGSFLSKVDQSHWMEYIRTTLSTAVVIARILHREVSA